MAFFHCVVQNLLCCGIFPLCCATFVVLQLVSVVFGFNCVATCFYSAVLVLLWCDLFLLCCANLILLPFVSILLC